MNTPTWYNTCISEDAVVTNLDSLVQVLHVVKDHEGTLAAQLQGAALQVGLGAGGLDQLAYLGGACEGDLVYGRVLSQGGPSGVSVAGDHVDDPRGEADLPGEVGEVEGSERSLLGRFQYENTAGTEGCGHLPAGHGHRVVPGGDLTAHSHRLLPGHRHEVPVNGQRVAVDLVSPPSEISPDTQGVVKVSLGGLQGLPAVVALQGRDVVVVSLDEVGHLVQHQTPLGGVHGPPLGAKLESFPSCSHGHIDICLVALRYLTDLLLGCRVYRGESFPTEGLNKLVFDEELRELYFGN